MGKSSGDFTKYPRTPHIFGSVGTSDDKHLDQTESMQFIDNPGLVIEEKVDGTNTGIHFSNDEQLVLQCRGHIVSEGMHPQFDVFKSWVTSKRYDLFKILGRQYIMFGEWLYGMHQIKYTNLPHYFLEFDMYDKQLKKFLNSKSRQLLLKKSCISSVEILHEGSLNEPSDLDKLITTSTYGDDLAEGLYLKIEGDGHVLHRAKYLRQSFVQAVEETGMHWSKNKITVNKLRDGVNIWE